LVLLVGFTILFAVSSPVFAQQAPPPSEKAKQIEALVTKAAALIDKNGKAAFANFRKKDSEWFHGDTHLLPRDYSGGRNRWIGMGRLYVSQAGTDCAFAEMDLREEGND
jgi:hypothetical protein